MRFTHVMAVALFCLTTAVYAADDKNSDDALIQQAEKLIQEGKSDAKIDAAAAVAAPTEASSDQAIQAAATAQVEKKESEIPVVMKAKSESAESHVVWRLVASMAFLTVIGGVLVFVTRRWTRKKDKGGTKTRIEMLHQFHIGPRRSLALVRVAGEAILIGVTDQNINMLKTVTLIDDEMEEAFKSGFNNFLEDEFSVEDVRSALGARV
jgi:flagellar protein FliO/FliZ